MKDTRRKKGNANILIVDDTPTDLRSLDEILSEAGYAVRSAQSEEAALNIVDEFTPDLMLLRILMPEVNGYELCRKLKGKPALENVPVIFTSTVEESFDMTKAYQAGGVDFIRSPFNREELLTRVRTPLLLKASTLDLESQLRARTEKLNQFTEIVKHGPMRVVITDTDGNIEYVNPAFTKITGFSFEEVVGKNPKLIQSGKTPIEVYEDMWSTIKSGKVWTGELLNKEKGGSLFWAVATIAPVMDQDGKITHFVAVNENITERRRLDNELQSTRRNYTQFVNTSLSDYSNWRTPPGLKVDLPLEEQVDRLYHSVCTDANQTFWESFGFNSKDEIIGKEYVHCVKERTMDQALTDFILNDYELLHYETYETLLDGTSIYSLGNWIGEVEDGALINIWTTSKNITEQKKAELALRESEQKFRTLVEHANEGILVLQNDKRVYYNPRWLEMIGYSLEESRDFTFAALIHPDDVPIIFAAYQRASSGVSSHETLQFRINTKSGEVRWLNAKMSSIEWEGQPAGFFLLDDINDRKQAQSLLQDTLDQLELSIKTAKLGVWVLDTQSGHLDWNDQMLDIYSIPRADFENNLGNWRSLVHIHPDDAAAADGHLAEVFEGQSVFDVRFRLVRPDGTIRHVKASASPIVGEKAGIIKIIGVIQDITDLIEQKEQVRYQAELLDKVNDAIISTDSDYRIVSWNKAAETIYGWSAAEVIGKIMTDIMPTTYPNNNPEQVRAEFELNGHWQGDVTQLNKQGQAVDIYANVVAIRDENNLPIGAIAVNRDITRHRKAEAALFESQARLALAIDAGQIGVWDWNVEDDTLVWDETMYKHYGIQTEDFQGAYDTWANAIHPDDYHKAERDVQTALSGDRDYKSEFRVIWPDGTIRHIKDIAVVHKDEHDKAIRMIGVTWDITSQKEAELELASHRDHLAELVAERTSELQRSEERYRTVVEDQTEIIGRWQLDGSLIFVNERLCDLFNQTREDLLNTNLFDIVSPRIKEEVLTRPLKHLSPENPFYSGQLQLRLARGEEARWFQWNQRGIFDQAGELIAIQMAGRDITERKHAEEALQRRTQELEESQRDLQIAKVSAEQANQAKSIFLANMSHEIRTPMNAVLGFSQLLRSDPNLSENQEDKINTIVRSGEHLLDLINDILEMSKIESGRNALNLTTFNLSHLLLNLRITFKYQASTKGINFEVVTKGDELAAPLYGDEGKIRQVIINLLSNAIKFTEHGGIRLSVTVERLSERMLSLSVEVQDSGAGIAPDEINKVFEPFVQTSSGKSSLKGTGLGLAICKQYVELMGGTISVSSTVELGSTFRFELPIRQGQQEDQLEIKTSEAATGLLQAYSGSRILVADDNHTERLLLREILENAGFVVCEATNGVEAIDQFSTWEPNLILMDMNMPLINGREATQRIRGMEKGKTIPILAVTANAFEEDRKEILELGVDSFIRKPFQADELLEVILTHLNGGNLVEVSGLKDKPVEALMSGVDLKEGLRALPETILDKMTFATLSANFAELKDTISQISVDYPDIAQGLGTIIKQFDYDTLVNLFDAGE